MPQKAVYREMPLIVRNYFAIFYDVRKAKMRDMHIVLLKHVRNKKLGHRHFFETILRFKVVYFKFQMKAILRSHFLMDLRRCMRGF